VVCHNPNKRKPKTLSVDEDSFFDHLDHGDIPGFCP
jgi:hypothetical protein